MIGLYTPNYNGEPFLKIVRIPNGFEYNVIDNASTDQSVEVCCERNFKVHTHDKYVDRIANWGRCVDAFINSDYQWMKWFFVGDDIEDNAAEIIELATTKYPNAKIFIFEYLIKNGTKRDRWRMFSGEKVLNPKELMQLAALKGNCFGAPVSLVFSKAAIREGYNFGDMPWVADMRFCLDIAKHHPVVYIPKLIGVFNIERRKYYSNHLNSIFSLSQEICIRKMAADNFLEMTGDVKAFDRIVRKIELDYVNKILRHMVNNNNAVKGICYLMIEYAKKLKYQYNSIKR